MALPAGTPKGCALLIVSVAVTLQCSLFHSANLTIKNGSDCKRRITANWELL